MKLLHSLSDVGSIASIAGLGVTLVEWLMSRLGNRNRAKRADSDELIQDYLEWLRRENHRELLERLQSNDEHLRVIKSVVVGIDVSAKGDPLDVLNALRDFDDKTHSSIDGLSARIDEVLERLSEHEYDEESREKDEQDRFRHLRDEEERRIQREYCTFTEKYCEQVAFEYGRIQALGIRDMQNLRQKLSIAYVSLNLKFGETDERIQRAEDVLESEKLLTVRGAAGSGKTTLLRWIAHQCALGAESGKIWGDYVPFFVPLRRTTNKHGGNIPICDLVEYSVDRRLWTLTEPENWLQTRLDSGDAALLIDGVDEMPAPCRRQFWEWTGDFCERYPGNRVYITSRHFADNENKDYWDPPASFASSTIDEMTTEDVTQFVMNWHDALLDQEQDPTIRAEVQEVREVLPHRLSDPENRRVRELCSNPLLCALVCALHLKEEGYLPTKRVELYDRCCTMLIDERDVKRRVAPPENNLKYFRLHDKEMVLQRLSLDMMRNKFVESEDTYRIEVSRDEALKWIETSVRACDDERVRKVDASAVLDYLIDRSGVLKEVGVGRLEFTHRTFQEYLAACAAGALNQAGDLAKRARDDQWRETIVIAAGTKVGGVPFGNSLIRAILSRGESAKSKLTRQSCFAIAVACLETGQQIQEDLRRRALRHLPEIIPPTNRVDARRLSIAGDVLIPLIDYDLVKNRDAIVVASCAKAIALIGSQKAVNTLTRKTGFGADGRVSVQAEICNCPSVHPFEVSSIIDYLVRSEPIPSEIKHYLRDVAPLASSESRDNIRYLFLGGCTLLEDIGGIANLTNLRRLSLGDCAILAEFSPIASCKILTWLELRGCRNITDISFVAELDELEYLDLREIPRLEDLTPLSRLSKLRELFLSGCRSVSDLSPIADLPNLDRLHLVGCVADIGVITQSRIQIIR